MKRIATITILICILSLQGFGQGITDKNMTFFGVDFSIAKMVGAEGFKDPAVVKSTFAVWNSLFKVEADKYDLKRPFKKDKVDIDFTNVDKHNEAVSTSGLVTNGDYSVTPAQVEAVVKSYDTQGKTGLGCVFVVESFDKVKVQGNIYVVLFDMASKKIYVNEKMEEKPGGFGLKAYWGRTILGAIDDSGSEFPKWVKGKFKK